MAKIKLELTDAQKQLFVATAAIANGDPTVARSVQDAHCAFAAEFGSMLRRTVQINNSVREIFEVKVKETGEMKFHVEPNDVTSWTMPAFGEFAKNTIQGDEIYIHTIIAGSSVYYNLDYAKDADYDVAAIALNKLTQAMVRWEEINGWALIRNAVNNAPSSQKIKITASTPGAGHFSKALFNMMLLYFEVEGKNLDTIYVPPTAMADIRSWTQTQIDPQTQREIFTSGGLTGIWQVPFRKINTIRYYKTIEAKKSNTRTSVDLLFNAGDKDLAGSDVWSSTAKTRYAAGNLEVCYGISKTDFGIMAIKENYVTQADPTAILRWQQGVLVRGRLGFAIIDSENVVMGIVDRTETP